MNAIHRPGLAIAAVVALLAMTAAVLIQSYMTDGSAVAAATPAGRDAGTATDSLDPMASTIKTIYVIPAETPPALVVYPVRPVKRTSGGGQGSATASPMTTPTPTASPTRTPRPTPRRTPRPSPSGGGGGDD
jgi:hypothetical protein